MKKIVLQVTLHLKEDKELNTQDIRNVCENVVNALDLSDNVSKDLKEITATHRSDGLIYHGKTV